MRLPHISDSQMELLASRLAAIGIGRRDFLRVAAGLATIGAVQKAVLSGELKGSTGPW